MAFTTEELHKIGETRINLPQIRPKVPRENVPYENKNTLNLENLTTNPKVLARSYLSQT